MVDAGFLVIIILRKLVPDWKFVDFDFVASSTLFECSFGLFELGGMVPAE
jgi:hypothetical protein